MRIKEWEREIIKDSAKSIFGNDVKVFLFGSRIDDNKKGGDIDLYITSGNFSYKKQNEFWIELQKKLGEQKIDIVYSINPQRDIEKTAIKSGIEL